MRSARRIISRLILLTSLTGCASAEISDGEAKTDMATAPAPDMRAATPELDMKPALLDMKPAAPDMKLPSICTPGEKQCADEGSVQSCSADGQEWITSTCQEGQACQAGECITPPVCQEGDAICFDESTKQVCRPGGQAWAVEQCPDEIACIRGECVSGSVNGSMCSSHEDCSGGKCHCGADTGEGCMDAFAQPSYCTSECSSSADCSDAETCMAADVHRLTSQAANYNHCVTKCNGTCPLPGMECQVAPVYAAAGELSWEEVCYFPEVKELGEECDTDVECLGGYCLKDYFARGYCSRRCETGTCPDDSACVELVAGEFWCTQLCGDGSVGTSEKCPLDEPDDRLDVTCSIKQTRGSGAKKVCTGT